MEDLFTLRLISHQEGLVEALIRVDPGVEIYRGHFPGFPITPGVCQVHMVRAALEKALGIRLQLSSARNIKFTSMHEPAKSPELMLRINYLVEEAGINADARLYREDAIYLKLKGSFVERKGSI